MKDNNNTRVWVNLHRIKGRILSRTRTKGDIIFGGQSIRKQIGFSARPTKDFDIFTKKSKMSALEIEKLSDKITRGDNFYTKKGRNPGTYKVKGIGNDRRKGSKDDFTLVDYTKTPKPSPKFKKIDGIKYRTLKIELQKKRKLIRDPKFKFRREKDLKDIKILKKALGVK